MKRNIAFTNKQLELGTQENIYPGAPTISLEGGWTPLAPTPSILSGGRPGALRRIGDGVMGPKMGRPKGVGKGSW